MQTVKSTHHMSSALKDVGQTMIRVNKELNLPALQEVMRDFAKESERLEMTEEMMSDAIDMAVDQEGVMEESDQVVGQVLAEIGIDIAGDLETGHAPNLPQEERKENVSDLEARFNALK